MKLPLPLPSNHSTHTTPTTLLTLPRHFTHSPSLTPPKFTLFVNPRIHSPFIRRNFSSLCKLNSSSSSSSTTTTELNNSASIAEDSQYDSENQSQFLEIKNPNFTSFVALWRPKFSLSDQAFFLLTFIACTTTAAFVSLVAAPVPTLYDGELQNIRDLISSAIINSNVKGGLRQPLGKKANPRGQYSVLGVWHTKAEAYNISADIRLIVRESDSFGFLTSTGKVTREVALRLRGITMNLLARILLSWQ